MKKILLLLSLVTIFATSCTKDDDKQSLSNTKWLEVDAGVYTTMQFLSDSESKLKFSDKDGTSQETFSYTYTYEHPIIIFTPGSSGDAVLRGTITHDKMELYNTSKQETIAILTRQ